ncbi:hypothetical protein Poli38472_006032 [Pythium oligandrum]|uniref:Cytochrome b5 heme-binding domain-containing protein n=1 Tax=Pythium oligandrum TaxID=41045 RepID=A0A8K1FPP1_PYTOL|nr:hypothetical protein Poli38472_006032 [Pythium oligandrum]|eukprot:TMW68564.1 hypothetical protein Poli38472_006032 [Pythium oligandrum]
MVSSVAQPEGENGFIAQYLATQISWWGSYRRILAISCSHVETYNPDDFCCTSQWLLTELVNVEIAQDPHQFVLIFERSRFRSIKVRFQCHARSHFLAVLQTIRRQYVFRPVFANSPESRRKHYRCSLHYADKSYEHVLFQIGSVGMSLIDENGRKLLCIPYEHVQRLAVSVAHPEGFVVSTFFHERLFLCKARDECVDSIVAAARPLGIELKIQESSLNRQLLRLRNSQLLDNPSAVCFEVEKIVHETMVAQPIQLIFQGSAMVEVHRKLRSVVHWPYESLLNVVRSDNDPSTVILQFVLEEELILHVESSDQFIAVLMLICREAGCKHVELTPSKLNEDYFYYPHRAEQHQETAGGVMGMFFLRRIIQAHSPDDDPVSVDYSFAHQQNQWMARQRQEKKRLQARATNSYQLEAVESQFALELSTITLNDHVNLNLALDEFIANVPLDGVTDRCNPHVLNKTIDILVQHLITLASSLQPFSTSVAESVIVTLQALSRLTLSPQAVYPIRLIPRFLDVLHELLLRQHFLTSYWCLRLLQCFFEPRRDLDASRERAQALRHLMDNKLLLFTILDLIPTKSAHSTHSAGHWMREPNLNDENQPLDQTALFTKEERLEKDMNILTYEALFTLHHVLVYLHVKERSMATASSKSRNEREGPPSRRHWAETINLDTPDNSNRNGNDMGMLYLDWNVATRAKQEIGDKLTEKYQFLMDAVVDVRLARSSQTIVALIYFLINTIEHERRHPKESVKSESLPPVPETPRQHTPIVLYVEDDVAYRRRRESSPLRRSSLDDDTSTTPTATTEEDRIAKQHERTIDELCAFLECYQADVKSLDNRSQLFPEQHTILVPLNDFRHPPSSSSSLASLGYDDSLFFDASSGGALFQKKPPSSGNLRLEHLEPSESEESDDDFVAEYPPPPTAQRGNKENRRPPVTIGSRLLPANRPLPTIRSDESEGSSLGPAPRLVDTASKRTTSSTTTERGRSRHYSLGKQPNPFGSQRNFERFDIPNKRNDRVFEGIALAADSPKKATPLVDDIRPQAQREKKIRSREKGRGRAQSVAAVDRSSTHTCDACIGCNDVCQNDGCFFCAEKEYQLRCAYGSNNSNRSIPTSQTSNSSFGVDRTYSSCEVKRHRTARSCWVIVKGYVYDVTDLLGVHSGGAKALLKAAASGKDCEDIMRKHPSSARKILENYRLGEFYRCEKRTLMM